MGLSVVALHVRRVGANVAGSGERNPPVSIAWLVPEDRKVEA